MTKYLLGFVFLLTMFSCRKDDPTPPPKKDYTSFLKQNTPTFYGKLEGRDIWWKFGANQSQSIAGYENGYALPDSHMSKVLCQF